MVYMDLKLFTVSGLHMHLLQLRGNCLEIDQAKLFDEGNMASICNLS